MLKCFRYIILASVLALFGVGTMATESQATHTDDGSCPGNPTKTLKVSMGKWTILENKEDDPGVPVVVKAMMYNGGDTRTAHRCYRGRQCLCGGYKRDGRADECSLARHQCSIY